MKNKFSRGSAPDLHSQILLRKCIDSGSSSGPKEFGGNLNASIRGILITNNYFTPLTLKSLVVTIAIVMIAAGLRIWPLESLKSTVMWLTFYPAVMIIAIYGGLWSGLLGTFLSCLTVTSFWFLIVNEPFIKNQADWLGMSVFIFTGTMISGVAEAMRLANRKALEAQEKAQIANKAKSEFLANMSHELRTPLNAILGYSQLIQRDSTLSPETREYLNTINRSGEHLLNLINDVLEISKIEAKRITIESGNFNLHNLIHDLKKMFEIPANAKGLLFQIFGVEDLPCFIISDQTKLRIILINLIGNAVKFTQNGSIIVRFSTCKDHSEKYFLLTEIEDTGSGIAEEDKDKLFKYFVQTETGKQSKSGTGLGLAISQDYARMMGGEITVRSRYGIGTVFSVRINIKEGIEDDSRAKLLECRVIGLEEGQIIPRILVAEDTEESRLLIVKLLKKIGFNVREAVNGKEAVEIFNEWKPDFIWMDIRMPVMDGLEATRLIKSAEDGKQTKIAALSAHVLGKERTEIFTAGCDDFVNKPFQEKEIFKVMEKHLELKYIYEETTASEKIFQSGDHVELDLQSLDSELLTELCKAVNNTDAIKISEIAEKLNTKEPLLSMILNHCAENFDYKTIRTALNKLSITEEKL